MIYRSSEMKLLETQQFASEHCISRSTVTKYLVGVLSEGFGRAVFMRLLWATCNEKILLTIDPR